MIKIRKNKKIAKIFSLVLCFAIISTLFAIPSSAYTFETGGKRQSTPVYFYIASQGDNRFVTDFKSAMSAWNNAGFGSLIQYSGRRSALVPSYDGYNTVTFGNRGSTVALAITNISYYTNTGVIVESDIDVNTYYTFKFSTDSALVSGYDAQSMFTHELGHALGLGEEYNETEATMYYNMGINETKKRSLHSDDISGLSALGY